MNDQPTGLPLTFIIPTAPYHLATVEQAVAACLAQTLACRVVVVIDHDRRGAGWARNQGLAQVTTPFVSFLDADDWIAPTFADACLRAYDGRRYVFTDWVTDHRVNAPDVPWRGDGGHHLITTLLPTAWVRHIGGFDEALPGGEDTDFYWKLTRSGLRGLHLAEPLVQYRKGGLRAHAFVHGAEFETTMRAVMERYMSQSTPCCGDYEPMPSVPSNQPQAGDVLATALWRGNRRERGAATGRLYPRVGNGAPLWMHPADIDAAPDLFARVVEMPPPLDDAAIADFQHLAERVLGTERVQYFGVADGLNIPVVVQDRPSKPDVGRVLALYQQGASS